MNVGDYIRIDGYISKIGHIKTSSSGKAYAQWKQPNGLLASANIKLIEKSSPQIIDLIEENDYIRIITDTDFRRVYNSYGKLVIYRGKELPIETFSNKFIGGIITHEQMEAMQYRVEE